MWGGIKLGEVCGLRQQQRHIPSWNAVIISLSLLPSFPFFFSSLCKFSSCSAKPFRFFLSQKNQKPETDKREMAGRAAETQTGQILPVPTLSCCPCPGCRWAADPAEPCKSSAEWSRYPSPPRHNQEPSESCKQGEKWLLLEGKPELSCCQLYDLLNAELALALATTAETPLWTALASNTRTQCLYS